MVRIQEMLVLVCCIWLYMSWHALPWPRGRNAAIWLAQLDYVLNFQIIHCWLCEIPRAVSKRVLDQGLVVRARVDNVRAFWREAVAVFFFRENVFICSISHLSASTNLWIHIYYYRFRHRSWCLRGNLSNSGLWWIDVDLETQTNNSSDNMPQRNTLKTSVWLFLTASSVFFTVRVLPLGSWLHYLSKLNWVIWESRIRSKRVVHHSQCRSLSPWMPTRRSGPWVQNDNCEWALSFVPGKRQRYSEIGDGF